MWSCTLYIVVAIALVEYSQLLIVVCRSDRYNTSFPIIVCLATMVASLHYCQLSHSFLLPPTQVYHHIEVYLVVVTPVLCCLIKN